MWVFIINFELAVSWAWKRTKHTVMSCLQSRSHFRSHGPLWDPQSLCCGVKLIYTIAAHRQTVALTTWYYVTSVRMMSIVSFLVNPIVVQMKWDVLSNCQFLQPPPLVQQFLNEATIGSVLLAALELFEDQATDRVLLSAIRWIWRLRHKTKEGELVLKDTS